MDLTIRQRMTWVAHLFKAVAYQYHRPLARSLRSLIPHDGVVVDVGAHAGQFAKLFGGMAPEGRVYAFEPGAYALSILKHSVRWRPNVTIVPFGLSDAEGTQVLQLPIKASGSLSFGLAHISAGATQPAKSHQIHLTTLDGFAEKERLTRLDFVKVDIEGWEARFLSGASNILSRFRPPILMEVREDALARAGAEPGQIFDSIMPLGYAVFRTDEKAGYSFHCVDGYVGKSDYLFVPNEKVESFRNGLIEAA
ncbi:MAG: FkbM family methyltransferase [Parvibaculum sp.]|uniref:FkbM family methyltransferase n=1 Tax=Parvibaculum sp. TaxID=2024848 RepID=UPI003C76165C